jgi:hypothetical protein
MKFSLFFYSFLTFKSKYSLQHPILQDIIIIIIIIIAFSAVFEHYIN